MNVSVLLLLTVCLANVVRARVGSDGYDTIPNAPYLNSSYKIHLEPKMWEEASLICQQEGAHLIVINSKAEADVLNLLRDSQEKKQFHVGMHCKGRWGHWVTVLGDTVSNSGYDFWLRGEPTSDEHCGAIELPNKRFNNIRCNLEPDPFICEKPVAAVATVSSAERRLVPCLSPGYETFPDSGDPTSSYKMHHEMRTWEQASWICQEEGGHLMVVNSEAEVDILARLRQGFGWEQGPIQLHVGIHCKGHWGHWSTVLGESLNTSGYNKWLDGEPTPNENCGNIQVPEMRYNNVKCNFALNSFICEKPAAETTTLAPSRPVPCKPVGYQKFPSLTSSYKMHQEYHTWEGANLICQEEGAHLIVINSQAEADVFNLLRRDQENVLFHVGMHCKGRWGYWVTVLGETVKKTAYNVWLDGEPTSDEHCAAIKLPEKRYSNVQCNFELLPFVCEKLESAQSAVLHQTTGV